jgi:chromosome segregation ATPase
MSTYELFGEQVELRKFSELEERIRKVVQEFQLLKQQNEELAGSLKAREQELEEAKNIIRGLNEERDSVRSKVDSLLEILHDVNV